MGLAWSYRVRRVNTSGSPPVFLQGWGEATCRYTCQCYLQLPPTAALTDPDTDITDIFPDVEIATPGIDCPDKKYFTTQKWDPLVLCRIIETFMIGTIQEFYHMCLVRKSMIYYGTLIDALRIGEHIDELDGNKRYCRWLKEE
jgi:hypothetical protein